MDFVVSIGLEVHVQLRTKTKAFSRSRCGFGEEPNCAVDPTVLGLPGALPVLNEEAVWQIVRAGMLFDCAIAKLCHWDRKNYFYPDSPKNYQITQQACPICLGGAVEIELPGPARNIQGIHRKVRLNRIHLEEDVGKLSHGGDLSLIDFNRAGIPLAEIVSEPELHSAEEAAAFLNSIRMHLAYAAVSDCDMEKGQMRCDVNISLRPGGDGPLGTRVEYKNLNSISGVRNAICHEIDRQRHILSSGAKILQETRRWEARRNTSEGMRAKEMAHDYCYFPEPDIPPLRLDADRLLPIRNALPERPFDRQRRFQKCFSLPYTLTSVLCPSRPLADFFEAAIADGADPKAVANFVVNDLLREMALAGEEDFRLQPDGLGKLAKAIEAGYVSKQAAQDALAEAYRSRTGLAEFLEGLSAREEQSDEPLRELCQRAIEACPRAVAEFRAGKGTAINAIKGFVMKESRGRADPKILDQLLRSLL
ncbi:MAG: Asp-tRNA(Asn)/Glu-tRNA(Gln) amidotransferase subunit GatB [Puniceicoccales bacterium]|jgi:aspartyl-tRNA(Asn)/glutamyl-tRNA(Gln) amidotransferase subunit B|nr:Asp-tRNA(Asn)/Glu-tRNA(Gln) amidotransferase subunit GatB [Puniceicoccales bacterium]